MTVLLDASAVLALLGAEPGADVVADALDGAVVTSVNLAEVLNKLGDRGHVVDDLPPTLASLGVDVVAVVSQDAVTMQHLRAIDTADGRATLSLADQACLAVALRLDVAVLTADRAWSEVDHGAEVVQIR